MNARAGCPGMMWRLGELVQQPGVGSNGILNKLHATLRSCSLTTMPACTIASGGGLLSSSSAAAASSHGPANGSLARAMICCRQTRQGRRKRQEMECVLV